MPEPTIAAGFARALMDLAERSQIDPAELQDQDNHIPFARYVALMRAGKELCHDPALALHFGEIFDMSELSIVGLVGAAAQTPTDVLALAGSGDSLCLRGLSTSI